MVSVWLFFDESGDFRFPEAGDFDFYVQAALICPDSRLASLEEFVEQCCAVLGAEELHGTELRSEQLFEVCDFLAGQDVHVLAFGTDTEIMSDRAILEHRLDQAARISENLEDYRRRGGDSEEIEEWMNALIGRAGFPGRISNSEYIQADFLITLIHAALKKSILAHYEERWRDDLVDFHFILDGKLPNKLAAGEKYLDKVLMPAISYDERFALGEPDWWPNEPVHPFHAKFSTENGLDAWLLLEHGLVFGDSRDHGGLQLIDVVAHVTRRAVLEPGNEAILGAYDLIRPKMRTEEGRALRIIGYSGANHDVGMDRYRQVYYGQPTEKPTHMQR